MKDISIEVEKLKAEVEALLKAREAMNERIIALSERIGELRSSLIEHEKNYASLEAQIKKTIEVVNQVKPDEIVKEITKFDAKIEAIKARISSQESLINRVIEEFKEMRRTFFQYKSLESIVKIADSLKKDIEKAKKVSVEIGRYAGKVESMFTEIQEKYKEFTTLSRSVEEIKEKFKEIIREFDKFRISLASVAKREDLDKLNKMVEHELRESKILNEELKKRKEEIKEIIFSSEEMAKVSERVSRLIEERKSISEKLNILDDLTDSFSKIRLEIEKLSNRLISLEEFKERFVNKSEINELKNRVDRKILEFNKVLGEVKKKIEMWDEKTSEIFKASKDVVNIVRKLKSYENSIKNLEKRQEELLELIETLV
ncbi:MAG: hypothetical protein RMJ17_03165 [Candidatus Aenigmarchaeota archaeon]|nr:hypothetical protein [Candidatus Aenigmarchaeota archaeon]MDW8149567.1 hypothetical protein [Candidatus Aenigmarchaeota archaeon]